MSAAVTSPAPRVALNAKYVAYAHSVFAYSAFFSALVVGCWLHYHKIVQNSSYGYPDEWFPSVSAAIGDRYPERSVFQLLIACTSGPRFLLVFLNFLILYSPKWLWLSYALLFAGVVRTITCGGWVYITSTDDHDWHDIFMIGYIVLTLPWTILVTVLSPKNTLVRSGRFYTAAAFFAMLVPLVYFFIQHKVHVIAGAYSYYAYCEWSLIVLDIGFDAWSVLDFLDVEIVLLSNSLSLSTASKSLKSEVSEKPAAKIAGAELEYSFFNFAINTLNAHIFWTVVTSLLLCVWYFPLWHMGISGYEAAVAVMFIAPLLEAVPPFSYIFRNYPLIPRMLTVVFGVGAYKLEDPEQKLLSVTAGVGFGVIAMVAEFRNLSSTPFKLTSYWTSFVLGLLTTSVSKYANHSNNPGWAIMNEHNGGLNEIYFVVGLLAAVATNIPKPAAPATSTSSGSLILAALALGAYFNLLKTFMSDSSTLVFWNWEGYPIRGPTAPIGGLLHFASFATGLILSVRYSPKALSSVFFTPVALVSSALMVTSTNWQGFIGSLGLTYYLAAIGPVICHGAVGYNTTALFFLAFFVSILLSLAGVWTVAYAFVPGGPYLREKANAVFIASMVLLIGGVQNYSNRRSVPSVSKYAKKISRTFQYTIKIVTLLLAFSGAVFWYRMPVAPFSPNNESSKQFTTGIWCVHFGLDNDMWSSETRMRDLIRDAEVDIIGLLETDTQRLIGGNRDFTQKIAHDLGFYVDYGPGPNKHTWGAALLSKFPILNSTHHLMPSPVGELAPAIHATLDIYGELVDIVVFHSGQEEDVEDRRLQSLELQRIMGSSDRPLVLLSYLVTEPLKGNYNTYVSKESNVHDIDSTDWDRWCEYILFRDLKKVAYARISRSTITDTELQVAKFKLLSDEQKQLGEDFLYGNHYISESEVHPDLRMPSILRGEGVRGHFYHVFDEPRYFADHPSQV